MTTRSCEVRSHTRSLPDRLDTKTHRQLAAEVAFMKQTKRQSFDRDFDRFLAEMLARDERNMGMGP